MKSDASMEPPLAFRQAADGRQHFQTLCHTSPHREGADMVLFIYGDKRGHFQTAAPDDIQSVNLSCSHKWC